MRISAYFLWWLCSETYIGIIGDFFFFSFFWFLHSGPRNAYLSVEDWVFLLFQFEFTLAQECVYINTFFSLSCLSYVVHLRAGSKVQKTEQSSKPLMWEVF